MLFQATKGAIQCLAIADIDMNHAINSFLLRTDDNLGLTDTPDRIYYTQRAGWCQ